MSSDKSKPPAVSIGGSPIYHHPEAKPFEEPQGEESIEQISGHIEAHLGKVETVLHEIVSDTVHIDVHLVKPTKEFPFVRLPSITVPDEFHELRIHEHKEITFFAVVPLHAEEIRLKLRDGAEKLLDKFTQMGINDIVDPSRRNVAKRRFDIF